MTEISPNYPWRVSITGLILIFLTSCFPTQSSHSPQLEQDLGVNLFYDNTCKPPCLLGITPGITSDDEAKEIVTVNKEIFKSCEVYEYTDRGGITGILCESVGIVFDKGIVTEIGYTPKRSLIVGQVIDTYGEPDAVGSIIGTIPEVKPRVKASLYYDEMYMQILLPEQDGNLYHLDPDTHIESIGFLMKEDYEELRKIIPMSWQGYGTYKGELP